MSGFIKRFVLSLVASKLHRMAYRRRGRYGHYGYHGHYRRRRW